MKVLKTIISVLLALVMMAALVVTILLGSLNKTIKDSENIAYNIVDDKYAQMLYDEVYASVDNSLGLVLISSDDFKDVLTLEVIREESIPALKKTLEIAYGTGKEEYTFESTDLYNCIAKRLSEYADQYEIEYSNEAADEVYDLVCADVTGTIRLVSSAYAKQAAPYMTKLLQVLKMWYVPLIAFVLCIIGIVLLNLSDLRVAGYTVSLPSYISSFLMLVLSIVLLKKDYLSKTILSDTTLQYALKKTYDLILNDMQQISLMLTILFLVGGIACTILFAFRIHRHHHHRHHHHHSEEK